VTSHWMCAMARKSISPPAAGHHGNETANLEHSGAIRRVHRSAANGQISFAAGTGIVHRAGYWRRGTTPPAPPTIWEFCQWYDLPVPPWAMLNAELHGWEHLRPVANRLNSRHAYLVTLSWETRLNRYAVESEKCSMERDREWASMGLVQTDPCTWRSVLLLKEH
jgi:hypothetical protein